MVAGMLDGKMKLKMAIVLVCTHLLFGCALAPSKSVESKNSEQLIARDIVNVLVQINQLSASSSTLAIPEAALSNDSFLVTTVPLTYQRMIADSG